MTEQIRRIASTDKFAEMYHGGKTRTEIAKYFGVSVRLVNNCCEYMGWRPPGANDLAPTPEEDKASRDSLDLAPMIAEKARKYYEEHLERRRLESEGASNMRRLSWHRTQSDLIYRVILSHNRDLE